MATLLGQWVHTAWVLHDGTLYAYVNGVEHCSAQFAQIQPGTRSHTHTTRMRKATHARADLARIWPMY